MKAELELIVLEGHPAIHVDKLVGLLIACENELSQMTPEDQFKAFGSIEAYLRTLRVMLAMAVNDELDELEKINE